MSMLYLFGYSTRASPVTVKRHWSRLLFTKLVKYWIGTGTGSGPGTGPGPAPVQASGQDHNRASTSQGVHNDYYQTLSK